MANSNASATAGTDLERLSQARKMLARAVSLPDIKQVHDLATAAVQYAKAAKLGRPLQNDAAKVVLLAERKAGEKLRELERDQGRAGVPKRSRTSEDVRSPYAAALDESGTSYQQANVWQRVADVPEDDFAQYLAKPEQDESIELTTHGLLQEQRAAEKKAAQEQRETEKAAQVAASPDRPTVALADYADWLAGRGPCDLLLTDPPYSTDIDDIAGFARAWLPLALAKVKPTGRAYVCIGAYPEEIAAYLAVARTLDAPTLANILVWEYTNTLGPSPTHVYKLNWQAILYFIGREAPPLDCPEMVEQFSVQRIPAPDGRRGNRYHTWQKPDELAERFIRHATKKGQLIYDCFAGTGTYLLAAARLGRTGVGCDSDPEMVAIAVKRGCRHEG